MQQIVSIHDVCFVNASNLFPSMLYGIVKGKLYNSLGIVTSANLQGLNDSWTRLMLEARVFTFNVFPDNYNVKIGMTSGNSGSRLDTTDISKDI